LQDQDRRRFIHRCFFPGGLATRFPQQALGFYRGETFVNLVDREVSGLAQPADKPQGAAGLGTNFAGNSVRNSDHDGLDIPLSSNVQDLRQVLFKGRAPDMTRGEYQRVIGVAHCQADAPLSQVQREQLQVANPRRTNSATPARA
jgi:hypothetical protein